MGIWSWFSDNAFNLLSAFGVIASLCFTAVSLRSETKTRRIENLLSVTANHREIWKLFLTNDQLARIRDIAADTRKKPITEAERVFVNMVIQHVSSVHHAMNDHLFIKVEGLRRDIAQFFSLPIPSQVWEKLKPFQNKQFIAFIEASRNWK